MKKLKKYKIIAVVLAVIIIPLVYSFFYLDAFWDPYSKLDKLPVAVVNLDAGTTINGETRNLGKEITDKLKTEQKIKWVITSDSDAKDGLDNRRYYASIYIPSDFSENISSVSDSDKTQGKIIYNVNEKSNFLASQVLSRVSLEFKDEISKTISEEIVGTLVGQIKSLPDDLKTLDDGLKDAKAGTVTLYDKTGELMNGQLQFNDGLNALNKGLSSGSKKISELINGSTAFSAGLSTVNDGLNKLNAGVGQLSKATGELDKNMSAYNQGNQAFTTGLNTYIDSVNKASETQAAMAAYIVKYTTSHPEALKDANIQAVIKTLQATKSVPEQAKKAGETLVSTGKFLSEASAKIAAGTAQINTGVNSVSQNSALLSGGTNKLNASYSQINQGIQKTADSITKASAGSQKLSDNATKIYDGETKLQSGIGELKDGISEASEGVSSSLLKANDKLGSTEGLKEYVSEPVILIENKVNGIPNYGTGFTPYFVSLSLWVGALMMFFAIYLDPEVKFRRTSKKSRGLLRFASYSFIGAAQALVLDIIILNVLHLQVKNIGLFFLVSIIIALSFTSIMRFLLVQLRDVGKFIAILFLILQLTSCGGTFPMELVPKFFKVLKPFMPMTYSVNALKEVISGIDYGFLTQNVLVLAIVAIVFFALNLTISKIRLGKLLADSKEFDNLDEEVCSEV